MNWQDEIFNDIEEVMVRPALDLFVIGTTRLLHRNIKGRRDISFVSHWTKQRYAVVLEMPLEEYPTLLIVTVQARDRHKRTILGSFYSSTDGTMLKDSSGWIVARILKHMGWKIEWGDTLRGMKFEYPNGLYE